MEPDRVKAIGVRPGDVLVFEYAGAIHGNLKDLVNKHLARELPGVRAMILDRGMKLVKVVRPLSAMRSRRGRHIGRMAAG